MSHSPTLIVHAVKRQSLKVRITAKDDSIVLQYLSSSPAIKLQGYVLGYGGRYSKQNITLPDNGEPMEVDVEFNPRYLIAVHPVAEYNNAAMGKKCKGNLDLHKPPQIMIDTQTPTSVLLTWGHRFKGKIYKNVGNECEDERHYTVRYREKEKNKKWMYQCCPTSETMIDNLKPNTVYEFGVRITKAKEDGIWSKPTSYATTVTSSPPSTEKEQSHKVSKKIGVTFDSRNPKTSRKPKPPGNTNIIGIKDRKDLTSSKPAHNRTNWRAFLPKKPDVNAQPVLERTPDQLRDKEDINKLKNTETSNTVSKPSLKNSKTKKEKEKAAVKPLTTKESKLPSSVNPSFPSKVVSKPDAAEIQIPVSLTPSTTSELGTMDKQQSTGHALTVAERMDE
ncbi:target of Nesh-SH3-like [Heptranchias perlo]|uniref:target of Nesh-SH3-like n=1 Tax=Heptranchias perlo TaxID=212740 RepID=UPI00355A3F2B